MQQRRSLGKLLSTLLLCDGDGLQEVVRVDVHRVGAPSAEVGVVPDTLNVRERVPPLGRCRGVARDERLLEPGAQARAKVVDDPDLLIQLVTLGEKRPERRLVAFERVGEGGDGQPWGGAGGDRGEGGDRLSRLAGQAKCRAQGAAAWRCRTRELGREPHGGGHG